LLIFYIEHYIGLCLWCSSEVEWCVGWSRGTP